jgi:hypothetical protein
MVPNGLDPSGDGNQFLTMYLTLSRGQSLDIGNNLVAKGLPGFISLLVEMLKALDLIEDPGLKRLKVLPGATHQAIFRAIQQKPGMVFGFGGFQSANALIEGSENGLDHAPLAQLK